MIRFYILAVVFGLSIQTALAAEARFGDGIGRWVCQPDRPEWPQVLIDFTEDAYRRCDQNTCVTYDLEKVVLDQERVHIQFAPQADFRTGNTGGRYHELIVLAGSRIETTGSCAYRGLEDIYDPRS